MSTGPVSARLLEVVNALPLEEGMRVLEIGCGPGVAAREVARRIGTGHVLGVDRSHTAITQALNGSRDLVGGGSLSFRVAAIEEFSLRPDEKPYDLAFAVRVGVLDGRHPDVTEQALQCLRKALTPTARLFIDGGNPLRELDLRR